MKKAQAILALSLFVDHSTTGANARIDVGVIRTEGGAELDLAAIVDALRSDEGVTDEAERVHG